MDYDVAMIYQLYQSIPAMQEAYRRRDKVFWERTLDVVLRPAYEVRKPYLLMIQDLCYNWPYSSMDP